MKLLFTRRNHPGSWLIRTITWSEFSHVDIIQPNGMLIGACAPHGVIEIPLWLRLEQASKAIEMEMPCEDDLALSWARSQLGKPYDWLGVVGIGLHRDWQEDTKWQCSEFAASAMKAGLCEPYRAETIKRLDPQQLYVLNLSINILK